MANDKEIPTINLANDKNDDWMKKANPRAYEEELRIHDELEKEYKAKKKKKSSEE